MAGDDSAGTRADGFAGYVADLDLASQRINDCLLVFIAASLRSIARAVPGELIGAAIHQKRWSLARSVAHARLMPPVVLEIGRLAGLVYRSSKWVGRPRTYIHYMDDPPRLVSDVTGRRLFIVGGSYRVTPRGIEG